MNELQEMQALLCREAALLDQRRWDDWLALYADEAVYWVPARKADGELTTDPDRELSLIYYDRKQSLRERVMRITSGRSLASTPLQRTVHVLGMPVPLDSGDGVLVPFCVHVFEPRSKRSGRFFGHYEAGFAREGGTLRIRSKKVLLANDHLELVADVYSL